MSRTKPKSTTTPRTTSTPRSDTSQVREGVKEPFWFQLYIVKDRGFVSDMIARAKAAKCGAILLTVDLAVPGTRYRDYRAGLSTAPGADSGSRRLLQVLARPDWAWDVAMLVLSLPLAWFLAR